MISMWGQRRTCFLRIKLGEIKVVVLESDSISPIARIGVEEVSRRGEIISRRGSGH